MGKRIILISFGVSYTNCGFDALLDDGEGQYA